MIIKNYNNNSIVMVASVMMCNTHIEFPLIVK